MIPLKEQKKLQISALNGKIVDQIQLNLHHQLQVKRSDSNYSKGQVLTLSNEACIIWSSATSQGLAKNRALYAEAGCHFLDAKFSPGGSHVGTLFRDGQLILWGLEQNNNEDAFKFQFPTDLVRLFDFCETHVVASGPNLPYILLKTLRQVDSASLFE